MALHINLYNEIQKAEQARRRDPLKLAGLAGIVVAFLFAFYYLYRLSVVSGAEAKAGGIAAEWSKLEPRQKKAAEQETEAIARTRTNQALVERVQSRFYWAPLLEEVASVVPPNVQITSLAGEVEPRKTPASIVLSGVAAGQQPRTAAEKFRLALQEKLSASKLDVSVSFDANSLEDSIEVVRLEGQMLPTATFKIRVLIKDKLAAAAPSATPAAPTKSK
ncbi:MAG: hypothetical protein WCP06_00550 [Verrucomicrobiota bacterium]